MRIVNRAYPAGTVVGILVFTSVAALTLAEEVALCLLLAGVLGAGMSAFWDIRWFIKVGKYRADLGAVAGFTGRYSYSRGEPIALYLHTTKDAQAQVYRFGARCEEVPLSFDVTRTVQSDIYDRNKGFDWPQTAQIETGDLEPGLYSIEIRQKDDASKGFAIPFIIKAENPAQIGVVLSTNSWDAYNEFGGMSKYEIYYFGFFAKKILYWAGEMFGKGPMFTVRLPARRPNGILSKDLFGQSGPWEKFNSKWARAEWCLIAFLEEQGYDYCVYADEDLAFDGRVGECAVLSFVGHSEYWSEEMFFAYDKFIAKGGKAFISSGMPMAGLVAYQGDTKVYSPPELESEGTARRAGGFFTMAGAGTAAPYQVDRPDCWVFDGTRLAAGDTFGHTSVHQATPDFADNPASPPSGASGSWTNMIGRGSGAFDVLAHGLNPDRGGAYMMFRETPSGGWIFSSGSEAFLGACPEDPRVARIVRNLFDDATGVKRLETKSGTVTPA